MAKTSLLKEFTKGLWKEHPIFVMLIGLCPTLAVSTSVTNGLAMGLATTFVIVMSNILISMLRKVIPDEVRLPCYIIVVATFVTIVDLTLNAYFPSVYSVLGIFIPLIVVNCIVLGRAEAFASKNGVVASAIDGLGMGVGFTWAMALLSAIRELLARGEIYGFQIFSDGYTPIRIFGQAPGAFIILGFIVAAVNYINISAKRKRELKKISDRSVAV
ncbi:MAG: electron transport complex subunit E [Bacteroidales bacterium]|nr:electron transport complex subunit E [Bacteroidales bacterium]MDD4264800.1 electron transport complex subunit E [Bacillota bacterium]